MALHARRRMSDHGATAGRPAPSPMDFERIAWTAVIVIGLVAAALFFNSGFQGYGTLSVLLALAASVNLAPSKSSGD